jgi:hypothetical protein
MAKTKKEAVKKETSAKKAPAKKLDAKAAKPMAKSAKKPEPKVKLAITKGDKKSAKLEVKAEIVATATTEEEEEEETPASGGMSASGLAMAAATAGAETSAGSLKNFRHHPDIENFYRFIYENDLRYEALEIIDVMATQREAIKLSRAARARPN